MKTPSPERLWKYVAGCLSLKDYLLAPGDGRQRPTIPPRALVWSLLMGHLLRDCSFHAIEALVARARRALRVSRSFGDDALAYFVERLDPSPTRAAAARAIRRAKRNKAFAESRFIGLAIDGTTVGRSRRKRCDLCRPIKNSVSGEINGYLHHLAAISIVGTGLSLPFDVEPYGPGDSEHAAAQRLLERAVSNLGVRFADYVVADGGYATASFLHLVGNLDLYAVVRLKGNVPQLFEAARRRFEFQSPHDVFEDGPDHVEVWDADDFDPWETLKWKTVRVLRYRQHKPDGTTVEAYWLTDFPSKLVGSRALYHIAKRRWEIENQGFNDAKNRYGLEHICHHEPNSLVVGWLLTFLAMTIERLYRIRHLRRGKHPIRTASELVLLLWLSLGCGRPAFSGPG